MTIHADQSPTVAMVVRRQHPVGRLATVLPVLPGQDIPRQGQGPSRPSRSSTPAPVVRWL